MKPLTNIIMHDGSRKFTELPQTVWWHEMREHLEKLAGVAVNAFMTDDVTEGWLDFTYREHFFAINNQFGDYWFFVSDPNCPEDILTDIVCQCESLLRG